MISSSENIVEVTPASPPPPPRMMSPEEPPQAPSPEIRVTDSPGALSETSSSSPRRSPPLSSPPSGASLNRPPLIFQPWGLPGAVGHAPLPFSIDNILKPTFGPRTFLDSPAFFSTLASAVSRQAAVAASAASVMSNGSSLIPERQRSPSSSSSSNGSMVKSELKTPPSSPLNHNNNQPVDLSSKNGSENKNGQNNASKGKEGEDGVPPGMVRGPNGQLWPAWVFCTRYSDRPSSGKFHIFYLKKK